MTTASIVMTTFEGERFLPRQLESFVEQTSRPDELIVADDRSTDGTVAILRDFAASAPFPVSVHVNAERLGFRRNFMAAAARATGGIILFSDQDDVWRSDKLATIRTAFAADPDLTMIYHGAAIVDADEHELGTMFARDIPSHVLAPEAATPWQFSAGLVQAFRSDLRAFDDLWPISREYCADEPMAHDRWYFFLALAVGKLAFLADDLLLYRQHGHNTYGVEARRTVLKRIVQGLSRPAVTELLIERAALSRCHVLDRIADRVDASRRGQVDRFAERYRRFAERLARRRAVYATPHLTGRARALRTSWTNGDYHGASWGFNRVSVPRDVLAGVLRWGAGADLD